MRMSSRSIVVESCLFSATQMHPHVLLRHQLQGMAGWMHEHLVPLPVLIGKYMQSVVYLETSLTYHEKATFFDFTILEQKTSFKSSRERKRIDVSTEFHGSGRHLASIRALYCVLDIVEHEGSAARPGLLKEAVQAKFMDNEIEEGTPQRSIPELISRIEDSRAPLLTRSTPFQISRGLSEFADQWLFCQVPHLYEPGREALVMQHIDDYPILRAGLAEPVQSVDTLYSRPMYTFDQGHTESRAYEVDDRLVFVHRLYTEPASDIPNATIVERF